MFDFARMGSQELAVLVLMTPTILQFLIGSFREPFLRQDPADFALFRRFLCVFLERSIASAGNPERRTIAIAGRTI